MNRPIIFNLIPFDKVRNKVFYRFFYPVKKRYYPLFDAASLKVAPNIKMQLVPSDVMHACIGFTGIYEEELTKRLSQKAMEGGLLIDVGANAGYFTLIWAALNPLNRVMAFEASSRNVEILNHNLKENGVANRVQLFPIALGDKKGTLPFDPGPAEQTGWGGIALKSSQTTIQVPMDRLDNLLSEDIKVDVMKVDVEGADTLVIMGAENLLRNKRIKFLFYEQNKSRIRQLGINENEAFTFLTSVGYHAAPFSDVTKDVVDWFAIPAS